MHCSRSCWTRWSGWKRVWGRPPDAHTRNVAGALVVAAHREGMTLIDEVGNGRGSSRLFAVQGQPSSPLTRMAYVEVQDAVRQSVGHSTRALSVQAPYPQAPTPVVRAADELNRPAPERGMTV